MSVSAIDEIERKFAVLSAETQRDVIDRLVQRMRTNTSSSVECWEQDLAAMAADPEVQAELHRIDSEFRATETDGLEKS